ncbi:MAG: TRAP transporter small permease subunit [Spirochaetales bacterium]|jgi:TRAP-type C4-dicarboxylate transport system permease small subunit|nr:TRAP transporter small permease subunit [Spirochaetales bacterium]
MENRLSGIMSKAGKVLYKIYVGIGIASMGLVALCVIYAVIARYFFSVSHRQMEEFITTVFAFTTFWGIGICFIEREHVAIDSVVNMFPPLVRKAALFFNYAVVLLVLAVMLYFGAQYALKYGHQISFGMRIPMAWMYGIIPAGCAIGIVCVLVNLGKDILALLGGRTHREEN